ncbi:FG-GAP-like repeat-containing protein [Streptomyces bambusae]|uniref:FG-GAP-like repeat-containing protein n=1 Tax=Streptomyces bambusae TaxID=1550616 RepID=UPI001CFFFD8D|nr:FG-GAP-like repeat-containing protein [Streptomyces bambusae]MCB5170110.1 FG-GAP-like repeat-containing protein [Streptomyces bambusae]
MTTLRKFARLGVSSAAAGAVLAGLLAGAAAPAQAAEPAVPGWVVPLGFSDEADGTVKNCTGIELGAWRAITAPDCFTGSDGENDFAWHYDPKTGQYNWGTSGPRYRVHPQYDRSSGRAGVAVAHTMEEKARAGRPVLATAADGSLYAPGTKALLASWTFTDRGRQARRHTEQQVLKSAADCATLLGRALPAGTLCAVPAPGTPEVPAEERCAGDAGGALIAGGKLIGVSATRVGECAERNVRLYTSVRTHGARYAEWGRDMETGMETGVSGSVVAQQVGRGSTMVDVPAFDGQGKLRERPDGSGRYIQFDKLFPYLTQLGDANGDGAGDMLGRTADGRLYRLTPSAEKSVLDRDTPKTLIGTRFDVYSRLVAARDLSGDGYGDLLGRDKAGVLWLHRGTADGKLAARTRIGAGWNAYGVITGRGDLSGDGISDLVARDGAGVLWLYRGNGKGGFAPRTRVGAGWNGFNSVVASGDMDGDGRQDLIARTPAGAVYLYDADHRGGFTRKLVLASGWKGFTSLS